MPTEPERLRSYLEREWEWTLRVDPILATQVGDPRYNHLLPDYSIEADEAHHDHQRQARRELESIRRDTLPVEDRLNYELYAYFLDTEIEGHRFPERLMPITQLDGIQELAPRLHIYHAFLAEKDYEDYVHRLTQIPVAIEQIIGRLESGLRSGITPPRVPLLDVTRQIQGPTSGDSATSPFYEPFVRMSDAVSGTAQERLRKAAIGAIKRAVAPAFGKLLAFWTEHYFPNLREDIALSSLPQGREWYEYRVRRETTTLLTPEEIHAKGLLEVQRIHDAMEAVMRESGFSGNFEEFIHFLRTDPRFYYDRPEDLVTGYRDICKRLDAEIPRFFKNLPRLTYGVREMPAHSAPSMPTGFYDYGSLEAGRPAWYYVNTYRLNMRPKWEMEVLSIHEAVPGHHLQLSLAREMQDVPAFRRYFTHNAYIEGWGLYSESLGSEMGFYTDPYSRFGWLSYDMWRAIRLVVDTGMHAFGWSRQQAIDYFRANSSKSEHDITVEIDRYIVWPAQALAYKIGQMKIQELRRREESRTGTAFNVRDFHDRILARGSLPLSVLDQNL